MGAALRLLVTQSGHSFGRVSDAPSAPSQDPEPGCRITLSIKTQGCYRLRWLGGIIWEIPVTMINRIRGPDIHILGGYARRGTALILCSVLLAACSLPMPVQITSWALDGIAYLTTEKSVTDHGISLVAKQDCALWRAFTGEQICRSEDGTAITVAAADGQPIGNAEGGYSSDARTLVALAPAAGPADPDAAAFWAADEPCGGYGECRQSEGRPEQPPDLVLARRPAVVRRRLDPWPARGPAPDTWLGPGLQTVFHGMPWDAVDTGPSFGAEPGD